MNISLRYLPCFSVVVFLFISFSTYPGAALDIYVDAQKGDDTNPGTQKQPFRTITAALTAIGDATGISARVAAGIYDATLGERFPMTMPPGTALSGASVTDSVIVAGTERVGAHILPGSLNLRPHCILSDIRFDNGYIYSETTALIQRVNLNSAEVRGNAHLVDCRFENPPFSALSGDEVILERVTISNPYAYGLDMPGARILNIKDSEFINTASGTARILVSGVSGCIENTGFSGFYEVEIGRSQISFRNCRWENTSLQVEESNCHIAFGTFRNLSRSYIRNSECVIEDTEFSETATLSFRECTTSPVFRRCHFHTDLILRDIQALVLISDCFFEDSGFYFDNVDGMILDSSIFRGGESEIGLYLPDLKECRITNCLITGFHTAIHFGPRCEVINCTIANNWYAFWSSAGQECRVINCILFGNENEKYMRSYDYKIQASHTLIDQDFPWDRPLPGEGNIVADPMFVDPENGDYRLQRGSPAVDSGSPVITVTDDFDGTVRPQGNGFDMGAYEFVGDTGVSDWVDR
ncbi:MAG: right-handed parallel beta-helix repeat-containing protein [bacterium]